MEKVASIAVDRVDRRLKPEAVYVRQRLDLTASPFGDCPEEQDLLDILHSLQERDLALDRRDVRRASAAPSCCLRQRYRGETLLADQRLGQIGSLHVGSARRQERGVVVVHLLDRDGSRLHCREGPDRARR